MSKRGQKSFPSWSKTIALKFFIKEEIRLHNLMPCRKAKKWHLNFLDRCKGALRISILHDCHQVPMWSKRSRHGLNKMRRKGMMILRTGLNKNEYKLEKLYKFFSGGQFNKLVAWFAISIADKNKHDRVWKLS